jgi:23S rRNA (adenine2503-C2)-methyltransferase
MHAPLPEVRRKLMPAENGMGIEKVVEMLREYDFTHQRRLSFEYIVFKGVNDSRRDMDKALELLKGIECRVNLIRFHKIPDADLEGVDQQHMEMLRDYLTARGITTTIRASRGEDIFAACGMLYSKERGE